MAATGIEEAEGSRTAWQEHFNEGSSSADMVGPETSHRLGVKVPDHQRVYTFRGSDGPEDRQRGMVPGIPRSTKRVKKKDDCITVSHARQYQMWLSWCPGSQQK